MIPQYAVRRALTVLLYFGALSALGGGVLGVAANGGGVPLRYLEGSPFVSYLVPGLILGVVVGGTQLAAALALQLRRAEGLMLSAVAGFGMMIWIFVELAIMSEYSFLQAIYFALGALQLIAVLVLLGVSPAIIDASQKEHHR